MAQHSTAQLGARHRLLPEMAGPMAKADLRKPETDAIREQIGGAIERMRLLSGLSLKELAGEVGRDERQIARWIAGTERAQIDAIFAVKTLRGPLVVALAELAGTVEVETTIRVKRTA